MFRIVYAAKIFFKGKGNKDICRQNLSQFITSRLSLKEILKNILRQKEDLICKKEWRARKVPKTDGLKKHQLHETTMSCDYSWRVIILIFWWSEEDSDTDWFFKLGTLVYWIERERGRECERERERWGEGGRGRERERNIDLLFH